MKKPLPQGIFSDLTHILTGIWKKEECAVEEKDQRDVDDMIYEDEWQVSQR